MAESKAVAGGRSGRIAKRSTTTDVDAKPAMSSPAKRAPRKTAPKGRWDEAKLLTSAKSALVDADLVKLLSRPEAWECLDESEKHEILALLPADTHPDAELHQNDQDAKIPPIPSSFLRYSNNWRDGIRQFQVDLEQGRYDPEWLRQAEQARKQREKGDFDSFKEREFEQFWGQKQRLDTKILAGDSAKVKLSQLIDEGVVLVGDVWRFRWAFGKGKDRVVVDKEARIEEIDGAKLSFTVPTGTRTFLSSTGPGCREEETPVAKSDVKSEATATGPQEVPVDAPKSSPDTKEPAVEQIIEAVITAPSPPEVPAEPTTDTTEEPPAETLPSPPEKVVVADATAEEVEGTTQDPAVTSHFSDDDREDDRAVQVIIVNQNSSLKRPIPQPESEPPAKRKRGRPRKHPHGSKEIVASIQEAPSTEMNIPASSGVSVEVITSPKQLALPAALETIKSTTQPEEPEQSAETLPPTDIEMKESTMQVNPQALPEPPTIPEILVQAVDTTTRTNDPEANQDIAMTTITEAVNTKPNEAENTEQQDPASSSPLTSPRSMQGLSSQPQESTDETAEKEEQPTELEPEPEKLETTVSNVRSPLNLVNNILRIDGRKDGAKTANAWKEIRCYRNNQDMGSLWEMRQEWYFKQK